MCVKFTLMEERSVSAHWGKQLLKHTWTRTQTVTRQPFQKRQPLNSAGKYFVNRCTFQSVRLESSLVSKRKPVKRLNGKTSYIRKHSPCWNPLEIASSTILLLWFLFRFLTQPQNIWIWVQAALLSSHWPGILIWEMGVTDYLSGQANREIKWSIFMKVFSKLWRATALRYCKMVLGTLHTWWGRKSLEILEPFCS